MLTEKQSRAICEKLLRFTKADDASVSVSSEDFSHLRFAANAFTTAGRRENVSAYVTVWIDGKRGSAAANDIDDSSLKMAVAEAERLARLSPVDKEYVPTLGPQKYSEVGGYVEATANISPTDRAKAIDAIIRECEKNAIVGAGFHHASGNATAFATKNGNFHYHRDSLVALSMTARTPDGGSSGYFLRNHFDVAKLDTIRVAREAIQKALTSRAPKTIEPGTYPVILEPQAAGDLVRMAFAFDARSADEGRSPFSAAGGKTKLGEKIFDERISVLSDPAHPELPDSPAASEGVPAKRMHFVRKGVLENLHYSRYWAKEKNVAPTPGPVNQIIEVSGPTATVEEMIRNTERGLLVGRFWYIRSVEPRTALFTGLTRDGVWWIENGKIQYPVRNFRFNQSATGMLAPGNIEAVSQPERVSSSESQGHSAALVPALKLKAFHFSTASEAV